MTQTETILVVGGGIVGVFAALRARQMRPQSRILLIEQDNALGGLLRSDPHPNGLSFDRGTHVLSETGITEIDALLFDKLDEADWRRFGGPDRDLCGLFMDDVVLEGSPFLPAPSGLIAERLAAIARAPAVTQTPTSSLRDTLVVQHGEELTDFVFRVPIRNLYRCELEELDMFVAGQLPLSRVVVDDLPTWLSRMADDSYRRLVACPDQRRLPPQLASPLSAIYPRRMGIGQLFSTLARQMADARVELCLSTRVSGIVSAGGAIASVGLEAGGTSQTVHGRLHVIWAAPPFHLNTLLCGGAPATAFKTGRRTVIVDFAAALEQRLGGYYYVDYGDNDGFRLTNYAALSEEAAARAASPFTLELWWRGRDLTEAEAQAFVAQRFLQLGLVRSADDISDVRLRRASQGALLATTGNMTVLGLLAETIRNTALANLINIGLLSEPRLFFTGDLLRNAERRLSHRFG